MKKVISLIIFLLTTTLSNSLLAQHDQDIQTKPVNIPELMLGEKQHFTLDNGLKVIVVQNYRFSELFYQIVVDVDPILENEATGYVSMAGELLQSGTTNKSNIEIDEAINLIDSKLNTYKNGLYGITNLKHKDDFLSILSDILLNPSFPEEEIEKFKRKSISDLNSSKTNPAFTLNLVGQRLRNPNHPYGEIMDENSIKNITREHLVKYYNNFYKPNTSYLVIVGNISLNDAKKDAEKYFGSWEKGSVPKYEYQFPNKNIGTRVALVHSENIVKSHISITYPINLKVGDSNAIQAILANNVFSTRLQDSLKEYKTSEVYSVLTKNKLVGNFNAYVQVETEFTNEVINQLIIEMTRMKDELVSDETLDYFKVISNESFARSLEKPRTIARLAFNALKYNLSTDYYQTYPEKVEAITKEQIQAASRKYIDPNQAIIIVVGDKTKLMDDLKKYSSNGQVELYDIYGNLTKEEIKKSVPEGVTTKSVLNNYFDALGGIENLEKISDFTIVSSANMNGMEIKQKTYSKAPNKYAMIMSMNGNVMMQQAFNGERGIMKSFQGEQEIVGEDLENLKINATMNAELKYDELGVKATLEAIEAIHNKDAYKLKIVKPSGETTYEYFDLDSGLKVQSKQIIITPQGEFIQMQHYSNYQEVDSIKFPFTIKISGVQNLELNVDSVIINSGLSDDLF